MGGFGNLSVSFRTFFGLLMLIGIFAGAGPVLAQQKAAPLPKVFHVPPSKIMGVITKTKGKRRALFIWKSTNETSLRFLPEYSTLEAAHPGSIISICLDKNPIKVNKYLELTHEHTLKHLIVKPKAGESIDSVFKELGVQPYKELPLVVLLDENNGVAAQGRLFIDYAADYILTDKKL